MAGRTLGLIAVMLLVAGCAGLAAPARAPASAPASAPATDVALGPTAPGVQVSMTVSLRLPREAELSAYLAGLSDPSSPVYGQYLSAEQFGARFGLPTGDIDNVVAWLSGAGLSVTRLPQRTSLSVTGSAGQVERLLGISLLDRRTADGRRYHVPSGAPRIPEQLAGDVASIVGLDTEPVLRSGLDGVSGNDVPNGGMAPVDVARAYGIDQLWAAGLHGEGVSVGLVALDAYTPGDMTKFDRRNGISGPPIDVVRMPDALDSPSDEAGEVALDLQVLRGIAPNAQIVVYEGSTAFGSMAPLIGRIVADGRVKIVSISFGLCEKYYPADARQADERELAAAYAAGISVFVASGDDGAYDCRNVQLRSSRQDRDLTAVTDWPSSSSHAIAVGGTYLRVRQDGSYLDEAAWADPLSGGSTRRWPVDGRAAARTGRPARGSTTAPATACARCPTSPARPIPTAASTSSTPTPAAGSSMPPWAARVRQRRSSQRPWCSPSSSPSARASASTSPSGRCSTRSLPNRAATPSTTSCAAATCSSRPDRAGTTPPASARRACRSSRGQSSIS